MGQDQTEPQVTDSMVNKCLDYVGFISIMVAITMIPVTLWYIVFRMDGLGTILGIATICVAIFTFCVARRGVQ